VAREQCTWRVGGGFFSKGRIGRLRGSPCSQSRRLRRARAIEFTQIQSVPRLTWIDHASGRAHDDLKRLAKLFEFAVRNLGRRRLPRRRNQGLSRRRVEKRLATWIASHASGRARGPAGWNLPVSIVVKIGKREARRFFSGTRFCDLSEHVPRQRACEE